MIFVTVKNLNFLEPLYNQFLSFFINNFITRGLNSKFNLCIILSCASNLLDFHLSSQSQNAIYSPLHNLIALFLD